MFINLRKYRWLFLFLTLVSLATVIAIVLVGLFVIPGVVDQQIDENMRLEDGNENWDRFKELPFPLVFKVYIYDVKNPDEIVLGKEMPLLEEKGPYIYKQNRNKTIVSYNDTEDTISYLQHSYFHFDEKASFPLKDTDKVTMLNIALWAVIQDNEDNLIQQGVVKNCLKNLFNQTAYPGIFISRPVKEFLFDGLEFCQPSTLLCNAVCLIASQKKFVEKLPNNNLKFSYFNFKNNTPDGLYTVKRGRDNIKDLGKIVRWNNMTYTEYWKPSKDGTECDHVKGTDSTIYPPRIEKNDTFSIYATDICRYANIVYQGEAEYKGINGYLYGADNTTLRSAQPAYESCFCMNKTKNTAGQASCFLDGVMDLKSCLQVPVLLSFPHFLWADKSYSQGIRNVTPADEEAHRIFLHVEPNTGIPLRGHKRVQLNAVLRYVNMIQETKDFSRTVLPLCWLDEGFELPDKWVDELNSLYFDKLKLIEIVKYGMIGVLSLLTVAFSVLFTRTYCMK